MNAAWWWIDRWRKSTAFTDMTLAQQGAYRNLLDELWLRNGLLPDNDRILGRIAGDVHAWPDLRETVMARFTKVAGGWRHETHDEVSSFPTRQSEKGKRRAASALREHGRFVKNSPATPADGWSAAGGSAGPAQHQPPSPSPSPSPSPVLRDFGISEVVDPLERATRDSNGRAASHRYAVALAKKIDAKEKAVRRVRFR